MEHTYTYTQTLQFLEKSVFVIVLSLKIEDHSNVGRAEQRVNQDPSLRSSRGPGLWLLVALRETPCNPDQKKQPMLNKPESLSASVR